jgi:hypothetical protein
VYTTLWHEDPLGWNTEILTHNQYLALLVYLMFAMYGVHDCSTSKKRSLGICNGRLLYFMPGDTSKRTLSRRRFHTLVEILERNRKATKHVKVCSVCCRMGLGVHTLLGLTDQRPCKKSGKLLYGLIL